MQLTRENVDFVNSMYLTLKGYYRRLIINAAVQLLQKITFVNYFAKTLLNCGAEWGKIYVAKICCK